MTVSLLCSLAICPIGRDIGLPSALAAARPDRLACPGPLSVIGHRTVAMPAGRLASAYLEDRRLSYLKVKPSYQQGERGWETKI